MKKAKAIETQLSTMLVEHKHHLLEIGSAGRLLIAGELDDVLPLEDADAFEKVKPISPDSEIILDAALIEARHDSQVKAVMEARPVALIVLGGAHDLSGSILRNAENCEYLRVTTKRFKEIAE